MGFANKFNCPVLSRLGFNLIWDFSLSCRSRVGDGGFGHSRLGEIGMAFMILWSSLGLLSKSFPRRGFKGTQGPSFSLQPTFFFILLWFFIAFPFLFLHYVSIQITKLSFPCLHFHYSYFYTIHSCNYLLFFKN